jgi:hypothetical protein
MVDLLYKTVTRLNVINAYDQVMEILESSLWVASGFIPTLALLEIYDRLRRGRKKSVLKVVGKFPTLITA